MTKKIVFVFDICLLTKILDDLQTIENIRPWRTLLRTFERFIRSRSRIMKFDVYKFMGDGWILLFGYNYSSAKIIRLAKELCNEYERLFNTCIKGLLNIQLDNVGISIGMDRGSVNKLRMNNRDEYIGRAINVACRLQGAIKEKGPPPQYNILMTNHLYQYFKPDVKGFRRLRAQRTLRNLFGDQPIQCKRIILNEPPRKPKKLKKPSPKSLQKFIHKKSSK